MKKNKFMDENNDLIKIKEDAIKIQEADVLDTVRSIEGENTKSSFVLGFAAVLFGIALNIMDKIPREVSFTFLILLFGSVVAAFWNIAAKKVRIHTNVDELFVHNRPMQWEEHLNNKHLRLRGSYNEAKELLCKKANLTRWAFGLLILSALLLVITKVFL